MRMENEQRQSPQLNSGSKETQAQIARWQRRLLPWLVTMPTVLILLFVLLATQQVQHFNKVVDIKEQSLYDAMVAANPHVLESRKENLDMVKWITMTKMEEESLHKRYYQGGLLLLSRIFIKYLGFLTGMIMAIVGSVFIIGKMSEDTSKIEGSSGDKIRFSVVSSSPGILFGLMGTLLMLATILQHNEITVTDQPQYLYAQNVLATFGIARDTTVSVADTNKIDPKKAKEIFGE